MRLRRIVLTCGAAAIFAAAETRAAEQQLFTRAPPSAYPVAVRLVMTSKASEERYTPTGVGLTAVTLELGTVPVGEQTHDAYAKTVARMFATPVGEAAELAPSVAEAGVDLDGEGWFAYVEHDVVLRSAANAEIARWRVRGQGRIVGVGSGAILRAFAEAMSGAARTFEVDFEQPAGMVAWLRTNGIETGSRSAALVDLPHRFEPVRPPSPGVRSDELFFAEVGSGAVGGSGWLSGGLAVRTGWSGRIWLLQLAVDAWPRDFVAQPTGAWGQARAHATILSAGLDAGVQHRLTSRFEVAAGVGAAFRSAFASTQYAPLADPTGSVGGSDSAFGTAASAFGAAHFNGTLPLVGLRFRLGLEVRKLFGTQLNFAGFGRGVDSPSFSASAVAGIELPWRSRPLK